MLQPGPVLEFSWSNEKINFGTLPLDSPELTVQTENKMWTNLKEQPSRGPSEPAYIKIALNLSWLQLSSKCVCPLTSLPAWLLCRLIRDWISPAFSLESRNDLEKSTPKSRLCEQPPHFHLLLVLCCGGMLRPLVPLLPRRNPGRCRSAAR